MFVLRAPFAECRRVLGFQTDPVSAGIAGRCDLNLGDGSCSKNIRDGVRCSK